MKRRILVSIVSVTILAVVLFGVPLAIVVRDRFKAEAMLQLERTATQVARKVPAAAVSAGTPVTLAANDDDTRFALYGVNAAKLTGDGPDDGDEVVNDASTNHVDDMEQNGALIVAVPVTLNDRVVGVVRAEQPVSVVDQRVWRAWLAMAGLAVLAVAIAALLARRQARRLNRPVEAVRRAAQRLGEGDFTIEPSVSGVKELDDVSQALATTAGRLGEVLARERAFSADASHQLRTPLTGLRIILETELSAPRADRDVVLRESLIEVDRLDATISQLLRLARDAPADRGPLDVAALFAGLAERWRKPMAAARRDLVVVVDPELAVPKVSRSAVSQVLDVLLDNAIRHGLGTVTLAAHAIDNGVAVTVSDEGSLGDTTDDRLFVRRSNGARGHGIGLALARSLAEAEGGRLLARASEGHTVFQLLLPARVPSLADPAPV